MFSAIYLICLMEAQCSFFVDNIGFKSLEECEKAAEIRIEDNQRKVLTGEYMPHTAEYQCVSWEKA